MNYIQNLDDQSLSIKLSEALFNWSKFGQEQEYAQQLLDEWKKRFYKQYSVK